MIKATASTAKQAKNSSKIEPDYLKKMTLISFDQTQHSSLLERKQVIMTSTLCNFKRCQGQGFQKPGLIFLNFGFGSAAQNLGTYNLSRRVKLAKML